MSLFSRQISANSCVDRFDGDGQIAEAVLFKYVDIRVDFGVVWTVFASRIVHNDVNKITNMNCRRECLLLIHGEEDVGRIVESRMMLLLHSLQKPAMEHESPVKEI